MNETSDKLRIFIINMAAQSLGELQEAEIISKVNDTVENMLDLFSSVRRPEITSSTAWEYCV